MNASQRLKSLLTGAAIAASVGVAFAQGTPVRPNSAGAAQGAGQESTLHTPMGQTGTPHGHPNAASQAGSMGSSGRTTMGAPASQVAPGHGAGQENTQHAPMGETGTPHGHPNAAAQGGSRSSQQTMGAPASSDSRVAPGQGAGQESTLHTPMGQTGTPHRDSK